MMVPLLSLSIENRVLLTLPRRPLTPPTAKNFSPMIAAVVLELVLLPQPVAVEPAIRLLMVVPVMMVPHSRMSPRLLPLVMVTVL